MTLRELLDEAQTNPEILDYSVNLSKYMVLNVDPQEDEDTLGVIDIPLHGWAVNEQTKEIRFMLRSSSLSAIEQSGDDIKGLFSDE